jgi:hypothetical protein
MDEFFASRLDVYEERMLTGVKELPEAYAQLARLVPASARDILDLGCGTGLELEAIFALSPSVKVAERQSHRRRHDAGDAWQAGREVRRQANHIDLGQFPRIRLWGGEIRPRDLIRVHAPLDP